MKKRIIALLLCMTTAFSMVACGSGSKNGTESTEGVAQETYNGKSSAQMDITKESTSQLPVIMT